MCNKYCGRQSCTEVSPPSSHDPPQVHGLGVLLLQGRPLHHEVIAETVQDLPRQRQVLHPADALHVDDSHSLYPQDPQEEGGRTDRNAGPWPVTQHLENRMVKSELRENTILNEAFA